MIPNNQISPNQRLVQDGFSRQLQEMDWSAVEMRVLGAMDEQGFRLAFRIHDDWTFTPKESRMQYRFASWITELPEELQFNLVRALAPLSTSTQELKRFLAWLTELCKIRTGVISPASQPQWIDGDHYFITAAEELQFVPLVQALIITKAFASVAFYHPDPLIRSIALRVYNNLMSHGFEIRPETADAFMGRHKIREFCKAGFDKPDGWRQMVGEVFGFDYDSPQAQAGREWCKSRAWMMLYSAVPIQASAIVAGLQVAPDFEVELGRLRAIQS